MCDAQRLATESAGTRNGDIAVATVTQTLDQQTDALAKIGVMKTFLGQHVECTR